MFHYLFNVLVFQFRVMDVSYFMDVCSEWEINDVIENIPYLDRNLWETSRLCSYITAQVNSRKKLQLQDICKFKWEEPLPEISDIQEKDVEISRSDIERLQTLAKQWEK